MMESEAVFYITQYGFRASIYTNDDLTIVLEIGNHERESPDESGNPDFWHLLPDFVFYEVDGVWHLKSKTGG